MALSGDRSRRRAPLGPAILATGLLAGALAPHAAHAAMSASADPQITLSNGLVVDLTTTIQDNIGDIEHISYTLHGPAGAGIVSISYPDGSGAISDVSYMGDDGKDSYDSDIVVRAGNLLAAVTTDFAVIALPSGKANLPSVAGHGHGREHVYGHLTIKVKGGKG